MDIDRFSRLPNELVTLIISLLPFVDAFRLCMARKEWHERALWLFCTNFELHEINFMFPGARQYWLNYGKRIRSMELKRIGKLRYVDFLNRTVFGLASPVLSKFSFQMYYSIQYHQNIDKWVKVALSKEVKELSLDFSDGDPIDPQPLLRNPQYVLPNFLYQSGMSIRVLNINSCSLGFCNFRNFIGLRSLTLTRVSLHWEDIAHMVVSCPRLETFTIVECYRVTKIDICFMLLKLKRLIVRHCVPLTLGIELCIPRLQYFEYAGRMVQMNVRHLDDLQEVVLDYRKEFCYPYDADDVRALFSGFADAKILKVCTCAMKNFANEYLLYKYGQPLNQILGIQHLTLKTYLEGYELPPVIYLLRSSPRLNTLSILTCFLRPMEFQEFMDNGHHQLPEELWTQEGCTLDFLQRVEIEGFTGRKVEIELMKFILKKSRFLRKLIIKPLIKGTPSLDSQAFEDLKSVAMASGNAAIKWH